MSLDREALEKRLWGGRILIPHKKQPKNLRLIQEFHRLHWDCLASLSLKLISLDTVVAENKFFADTFYGFVKKWCMLPGPSHREI